ncbi:penicillin-binding transpeptidase domain-containing protein [Streptomyces sp. 7-21]|uniref:penicillin-binding transpeptidase domain-containing protein n=1 Tax=Streptomyces sp. 7-21 TaxID=2802283 RepID=UPI00191E1BCF|nr:penicillin-binding transpeptidase domain-containing protein [Streptomyces sp. 7-21]MBL1068683.1 penicillin-binding protein [Streptomyces sp. 7-21]
MRDGQRLAVIGGAVVAAATVVGFAAYGVMHFGGGDGDGTGTVAAASGTGQDDSAQQDGPPAEAEVRETAAGFLTAWEEGDARAAAALTDDPGAARAALEALAEEAGVTDLTVAAGEPEEGTVPFTVDARIAYRAQGERHEAPFGYESELTVVRSAGSGEPVVHWEPSVLYPGLREGQSLATGPLQRRADVEVLDANGDVLSAEEFPSLAPVLADVAERYEEESGAFRGRSLNIVDAGGEVVERLQRLAEPETGQVPTTIDPAVQRAAEDAVAAEDGASAVAIEPSTGAIRAIANENPDGFNTALQGSYAPGSTFKIVSASLLIQEGLASAGEPHPCPKFFEYGGWRFQNLDRFEIRGGTFADSFSASCNTAFISQAPELDDDALGNHARDVFGLGLTWEVGTATMDGQVPTQSGAQMAASLIGQGGVRMNPLTMASVSATVQNGGFRQPYLVPAEFDGRQLAQAPGELSPAAAEELRGLMNTTARYGTAAEAMAGLDGDIGAKTGSAEVDGQERPNAWFTGYRNDLAVAAVVPDSGHGGEFAGPIVADVLRLAG